MKKWFREPISGLTHAAGALLAVPGLAWLVTLTTDNIPKLLSMVVYALSLIFLFTSSAVMHLVKGSHQLIDRLNRIDHAAIYVLIAGSYTPICFNVLQGPLRWGLLATVWTLAAVGIVHKIVIGPGRKSSTLSTLFYLAMGWLAVLAFPQLIRNLPLGALVLIALGGLAYSAGSIIYMLDDPDIRPGFGLHEIWHLFVLAGSGFHFAAIATYIA